MKKLLRSAIQFLRRRLYCMVFGHDRLFYLVSTGPESHRSGYACWHCGKELRA
jgi:hypothetical protein